MDTYLADPATLTLAQLEGWERNFNEQHPSLDNMQDSIWCGKVIRELADRRAQTVRLPREVVQRCYAIYVSDGYGSSDGYYAPIDFIGWLRHAQQAIHDYVVRAIEGEPIEAVEEPWQEFHSFDRALRTLGEEAIAAARRVSHVDPATL